LWIDALCLPLDLRLKTEVCAIGLYHGVQLITVLLSTKTYHEASLTLRNEDYDGDPLGEQSYVLPWSLATLTSAAAVELRMTTLVEERIQDVATRVVDYISS